LHSINKTKISTNGFSLLELISVIGIISIIGIIAISFFDKVQKKAQKIIALNLITNIKRECETNNLLEGENVFSTGNLIGYSFNNADTNLCTGNPNLSLVAIVPKDKINNPTFFYNHANGEISCSYENSDSTNFPDCKKINFFNKKKYRCGDIGDWSKAQNLLGKGHQYLDRDKDGEACETLGRKSHRPRFGNIIVKNCYDGDTCTTNKGEKIRLACIDTPEIKGKRANPIKAKEARDYLNSLVKGKQISIRRITEDRYGRTVGELSLNGENLQEKLVYEGYAQIYKRYSNQCSWSSS
tara:strand:+ start:10368 stop:11261 length:894 start_codon:yes stop_codon:yes gene_type:complete